MKAHKPHEHEAVYNRSFKKMMIRKLLTSQHEINSLEWILWGTDHTER
jgi:hypothetical protein